MVTLPLDYVIHDAEERSAVEGPVPARQIEISALLFDSDRERESFELLELGGPLSLFIDIERGLPIQISSANKRTGQFDIRLLTARL